MLIRSNQGPPTYLSYCTNVHAGEHVDEIISDLTNYSVPLKALVCPDAPFALGLRLGEAAVDALVSDEGQLNEFDAFLKEHDLLAYTFNIFPQGAFHSPSVKEKVYLPDWSQPGRLRYTVDAAKVLARLLHKDAEFGSLSTLPLGFRSEKPNPAAITACTRNLLKCAQRLSQLEASSGKRIVLCIEPEPMCLLETTAEFIHWYEQDLIGGLQLSATQGMASDLGITEDIVRRHIGICFDACHHAVQYEEPPYAIETLENAGITVGKVQFSSALELRKPRENPEGLKLLQEYQEPRFLHQVVAIDERFQRHRFLDLGEFFSWLKEDSIPLQSARCHFHVPIHSDSVPPLHTTRDNLEDLFARHQRKAIGTHFEVETYTFPVLPNGNNTGTSLVDSLEAELRYAETLMQPESGIVRPPLPS